MILKRIRSKLKTFFGQRFEFNYKYLIDNSLFSNSLKQEDI